jgi:hypothetical protein
MRDPAPCLLIPTSPPLVLGIVVVVIAAATLALDFAPGSGLAR